MKASASRMMALTRERFMQESSPKSRETITPLRCVATGQICPFLKMWMERHVVIGET